jgi:hypothetical protein
VNFRFHQRLAAHRLLPSPYFLTSLHPYFVFDLHRLPRSCRGDEDPVTTTPLESAFTNRDARNPFRIRFYENAGVVVSLTKNHKRSLEFVFSSRALCSLFSLFAPRVFHNSFALKRFRTLSENRRGGMGISNKNLQELLEVPSRPGTTSPRAGSRSRSFTLSGAEGPLTTRHSSLQSSSFFSAAAWRNPRPRTSIPLQRQKLTRTVQRCRFSSSAAPSAVPSRRPCPFDPANPTRRVASCKL